VSKTFDSENKPSSVVCNSGSSGLTAPHKVALDQTDVCQLQVFSATKRALSAELRSAELALKLHEVQEQNYYSFLANKYGAPGTWEVDLASGTAVVTSMVTSDDSRGTSQAHRPESTPK